MLVETYNEIIDNIAALNEAEEIHVSDPDEKPVNHEEHHEENHEAPTEHEESTEHSDPRSALKDSIKAQAEIAESVINSIKEAYADKCQHTTIMGNMEDQIKNWEQTMKGACHQVVQMVNQKRFTVDKRVCNPHAYNMIKDCASRDTDALKTAAAVIVFYNSLG